MFVMNDWVTKRADVHKTFMLDHQIMRPAEPSHCVHCVPEHMPAKVDVGPTPARSVAITASNTKHVPPS
jgi:ornithine carbamoyltransferase